MSVFVEQEVENLIRTGLIAEFTAYNAENETSHSPNYRRFFSDDAADEDVESITFPMIQIGASPNTPRGYREPLRQVPVLINIGTLLINDPKRAELAALYNVARNAVDTRNWNQDTGALDNMELTIEEGGEILEDENGSYVTMNLTAEVCVKDD